MTADPAHRRLTDDTVCGASPTSRDVPCFELYDRRGRRRPNICRGCLLVAAVFGGLK